MLNTSLTPPNVDQATIDRYVAKGSRLRANAFADLFRAIFSTPETLVVKPAAKAINAA